MNDIPRLIRIVCRLNNRVFALHMREGFDSSGPIAHEGRVRFFWSFLSVQRVSVECPVFDVLGAFILLCYGVCNRCFEVRSCFRLKLLILKQAVDVSSVIL